jgi:hypothetical protein
VHAKRQNNERANINVGSLTKSLRAAEAKLKAQHGQHRKIEFDVVIRNGKAVVKPIVR